MSEMFKPKQFDSFDKVPDNQKSKFKKEEDGSFVYKEAVQELSNAELTAEIANTLKEQGITSMDVLHNKANKINEYREYYRRGHDYNGEEVPSELWDDKEFVISVVRREGNYLEKASEKLKNDKDVVGYAVNSAWNNTSAFNFASEKLKDDREFVIDLLKNERNYKVLEYASENLKNDREFVMEALKHSPFAIRYAPEYIKHDKKIALEIIKRNVDVFDLFPKEFMDDKEIVLEIVKKWADGLRHASDRLKNDREVVLEAVKHGGYALEYASKDIQKEIKNLLGSMAKNED